MFFAKILRLTRLTRGLNLRELAEMNGTTAGYISKIESRGEIPSPAMTASLAKSLNIDVGDFIRFAMTDKCEIATSRIKANYENYINEII